MTPLPQHSRSFSNRRTALLRALLVALSLVIFVVALRPMPEFITEAFNGNDKLEHVVVFLGLALVGVAAWPGRAVTVVLGLLGFGLAIELAQAIVGGRQADARDWMADAVGVGVALLLMRTVVLLQLSRRSAALSGEGAESRREPRSPR